MLEAIISGTLLGLALVFAVGPIVLKTIKTSINYGHLSAFFFISGVWLSDIVWILLANLFSSLLSQLNAHRTFIGLLGGTLLIGIGIYYLFFKKYKTKAELDSGIMVGKSTYAKLFTAGFLINTLNPGSIALWIAAAAKTVNFTTEEKIVAFSICLGISMTADFFKIELAGKLRKKLTEQNLRRLNKISGVLFLLFGFVFIAGAFYIKRNG